ncbi:hypothetical protein K435DRAFT_872129 [Dendrothele bispora CBS 962.96]|uniref:Transmembrane protein n=1 Tax=Dendrothele bispora (strain CBS 962.96) TaxID=1314807 RepID=A0A4S8L2S7_DENBC|nr:hypothetical protein K435DRAFT_872129 [Dendrothele bispora CBS 962.96]
MPFTRSFKRIFVVAVLVVPFFVLLNMSTIGVLASPVSVEKLGEDSPSPALIVAFERELVEEDDVNDTLLVSTPRRSCGSVDASVCLEESTPRRSESAISP